VERKSYLENMGIDDKLAVYKGKKVLVTGHTGFKGSWLSLWLTKIGAQVIGVSLDPRTSEDNYVLSGLKNMVTDYRADIRKRDDIIRIVEKEEPEILFHLAAQPIVLESYNDPVYTYETNLMGTVNMLEVFRLSEKLKTAVFITSDKCYENLEKEEGYVETDPMGGYDPYSSSKGAAELAINSFRRSFFQGTYKKIASARAGNVIGGGDWSPNRLVVDIVKAIQSDLPVEIRNPYAVRPWQHVLDPVAGYLLLGSMMVLEGRFDEAWNFGPEPDSQVTVKEIVDMLINEFGRGQWNDISGFEKPHEANLLSLNITKAKEKLGWRPVLSLPEAVKYTVEWYESYRSERVSDICMGQIEDFTNKWKSEKNG
jgi:CDP-glucose 4,6-dehydratase